MSARSRLNPSPTASLQALVHRLDEIVGTRRSPQADLLGLAAAALTAHVLNRVRLSRYVANPPLVFVALAVIYTCVVG